MLGLPARADHRDQPAQRDRKVLQDQRGQQARIPRSPALLVPLAPKVLLAPQDLPDRKESLARLALPVRPALLGQRAQIRPLSVLPALRVRPALRGRLVQRVYKESRGRAVRRISKSFGCRLRTVGNGKQLT